MTHLIILNILEGLTISGTFVIKLFSS